MKKFVSELRRGMIILIPEDQECPGDRAHLDANPSITFGGALVSVVTEEGVDLTLDFESSNEFVEVVG